MYGAVASTSTTRLAINYHAVQARTSTALVPRHAVFLRKSVHSRHLDVLGSSRAVGSVHHRREAGGSPLE